MRSLLWVLLIVALLGVGVLAVPVLMPTIDMDGHSSRSKSADNMKALLTLMIAARSTPADYPSLNGRSFILALVANGQLDAGDPEALEVLWPPRLTEQFQKLDPHAYEQVTLESLKTRRFPHLTGYAGRRNAEPDFAMNEAFEKRGTPLIADLTDPDGILLGFSNGHVGFMSWEGLAMEAPVGPVVVGPKATSPYLRMLSSE